MKMVAGLKARLAIWIWNHTPTCMEISRLASRAQEQPLGWRARLKMRLHFLICVWCKRYCQHLEWMHKASPHLDEHTAELPARGLSPEAKHRIVLHLKSEAQKKL